MTLSPDDYRIERREENVVLVRVRSRSAGDETLPEAVFTFRAGDPQFLFWDGRLREQESGH